MANSVYFFENGLRKVYPYYFAFNTHVKTRWMDKTLLEVFSNELGQNPELIKQNIKDHLLYIISDYGKKNGSIVVKGWNALEKRKLNVHDVIYNSKHMHEPSVPHSPISSSKLEASLNQFKTSIPIVHENTDLIVVDKPSGIATHPTGSYRYNSITEILKYDLEFDNIWPCHRLDKCTSGILILAKTKLAAGKFLKLVKEKEGNISKEYIARVEGNFPDGKVTVNCPIFSLNTGGYLMQSNIEKLPVNSCTKFTKIRYDSQRKQSIVICQPLTGRMHQIRIHLRNMGHPIVNDFLYNYLSKDLDDIRKLKNEIEIELYQRIFLKFSAFSNFRDEPNVNDVAFINILELTKFYEDLVIRSKIEALRNLRKTFIKTLKTEFNQKCTECGSDLFDRDSDACLTIYLHAYKYSSPLNRSLSFETNMPHWCLE
ncbi:uncharacterized protein PRCAT00001574001 [Priceomyces carsonii]|uniref:uncharacterized protein n=1 Tax=Priceomyces carsonii TaxID=28549 RepID=UPI002ED85D1B|nr:unnamed protein product [Priceomyces carsonii]